MGQASSSPLDPPNRDWVVMLKPGTTQQTHQDLMEQMTDMGNSISFVYWPNPLGFALRILDGHEVSRLRSHPDVHSVAFDQSVEQQPEDDTEDLWKLFGEASTKKLSDAETEVARLSELAALLAPKRIDAWTARRFLRAKRGNVQEAATFYKAHLDWRDAEGIDTIRSGPLLTPAQEAFLAASFTPRVLEGVDLEGRPVLFFAPHDIAYHQMAAIGLKEEHLLRRYVGIMEDVCDAIKASQQPTKGCLWIYDFRHLTVMNTFRALGFYVQLGKLLEANYPDILGSMTIIGAPPGSEWLLTRIKGFLSPSATRKIQMAGGAPLEVLKRLLPPEVIPQEVYEAAAAGAIPRE